MGESPQVDKPPHGGGSRYFAVASAVLVVLVLVSSVVFGAGEDLGIVRFLSGDAWLRTGDDLTLVDTGSGQVKRTVPSDHAGNDYDIVQRGGVAFLVDRTTGAVCTLELGAPQRCTKAGVGDAIDIVVGGDRAYLMDKVEGAVRPWNVARNAAEGRRVRLSSALSRGVVNVDGGLSTVVLERGSLASVVNSDIDRRVPIGEARRDYEPALVGEQLAVVDTEAGVLWWVEESGTDGPIDLGAKRLLVPARVDGNRFVAWSQESGELVVLERGGSPRRIPVEGVSEPGRPEVAGDTAVIPDRATGEVVLVDLAEGEEVRREEVADDGADLELVSKDGRVVANDTQGPDALTITRLGVVVTIVKADVGDGQGGDQGNGNDDARGPGPIDPGTGVPGTGDPGPIDPGTGDPGRIDPGAIDPGTVDPGTGDPGTGDPVVTDPGTSDPVVTDPGTGDPVVTDPGTGDPVVTDPPPTTGVPGAPTNPVAVAGDGSVSVSWGAAAANGLAINQYRVEAVRRGAGTRTETTVGGSATTANLTGLTNGQTYDIYVSARNSAGVGPTAQANATPQATTPPAPRVNAFDVVKDPNADGRDLIVTADVDNVSTCGAKPTLTGQVQINCKGSTTIRVPTHSYIYTVDLVIDGGSGNRSVMVRAGWKYPTTTGPTGVWGGSGDDPVPPDPQSPIQSPTQRPPESFDPSQAVVQCYSLGPDRWYWIYAPDRGTAGWGQANFGDDSDLYGCSFPRESVPY